MQVWKYWPSLERHSNSSIIIMNRRPHRESMEFMQQLEKWFLIYGWWACLFYNFGQRLKTKPTILSWFTKQQLNWQWWIITILNWLGVFSNEGPSGRHLERAKRTLTRFCPRMLFGSCPSLRNHPWSEAAPDRSCQPWTFAAAASCFRGSSVGPKLVAVVHPQPS